MKPNFGTMHMYFDLFIGFCKECLFETTKHRPTPFSFKLMKIVLTEKNISLIPCCFCILQTLQLTIVQCQITSKTHFQRRLETCIRAHNQHYFAHHPFLARYKCWLLKQKCGGEPPIKGLNIFFFSWLTEYQSIDIIFLGLSVTMKTIAIAAKEFHK